LRVSPCGKFRQSIGPTPEKEARLRQRRHIGSSWREERPAIDEGTLAHGVKDHIKAIQVGQEVFAAIVNDVVIPVREGRVSGAGLCSPFFNFHFGGTETGSIIDRNRFC
jgi:hypothetical protein